jgi:biofilm PGA synthesis N-glycosyltransferase PgaC
MKPAFWISFSFVAYTYLGYPLWLFVQSRWRSRPISSQAIIPSVSVVMAAYNEAGALPKKLQNLADQAYPAGRIEIIVVSDGSTDDTDRIMVACTQDRVHYFALPQHAGKAVALNRAIRAAEGEIIVFTDVRQSIDADAVRFLVSNFADPQVGCVSGELMLGDGHGGAAGKGLGLYWKLEKKIREWESASGSVMGVTGALYAARKELLVPIPEGTLLDDVYLPLHITRQGKRVIFEPRARAYDTIVSPGREFRRKVRTLAGNYQLVRLAPWLLTPLNPVRFRFICHKLFRLWVPFGLAGLLVTSALLRSTFYQVLFLLQILFYGLGLLALCRPKLGLLTRLADVCLAFMLMNTAAAVALVWFLGGKKEIWARS